MSETKKPVVMTISGHDPSGGAGIQADIEAIKAQGCHAVSVVTCLTVQNTVNVAAVHAVDAGLVRQQARVLLDDIKADIFKIGLTGSVENVNAIRQILLDYPGVPVILDPVLAAGGGKTLSNGPLLEAITDVLLPLVTVITPNLPEAQQLSAKQEVEECAGFLLAKGCSYVLITGTHAASDGVDNHLFGSSAQAVMTLSWERLPHSWHGSGCTLASSIAAFMAQGLSIAEAVTRAQEYTWHALKKGFKPGTGQYLPER